MRRQKYGQLDHVLQAIALRREQPFDLAENADRLRAGVAIGGERGWIDGGVRHRWYLTAQIERLRPRRHGYAGQYGEGPSAPWRTTPDAAWAMPVPPVSRAKAARARGEKGDMGDTASGVMGAIFPGTSASTARTQRPYR